MDKQLIAQIFGNIWLVNLLIPIVLMFAGLWWNHTFRTDKANPAFLWQRFKYNRGELDIQEGGDATASYFLLDVFGIGLVLFLLGAFTTWAGVVGFVVLGAIVGFVIIPRFVIDIFRGLAYNRKTGDCERIEELARELQKLKEKRDA